jgi:hypothetical protein
MELHLFLKDGEIWAEAAKDGEWQQERVATMLYAWLMSMPEGERDEELASAYRLISVVSEFCAERIEALMRSPGA